MPLDEKRKLYSSSTFYTVDKISIWHDYFLMSKERLKMQFSGTFGNRNPVNSCSVDPELNMKVSLWAGSITQLEIDAIVNAADSLLSGSGGVDKAIHFAAGANLKPNVLPWVDVTWEMQKLQEDTTCLQNM